MFSGIVKEQGTIKLIKSRGNILETVISCNQILKELKIGDSVCVNGCCLTVVSIDPINLSFSVELTQETIHRTNFCLMQEGVVVNIEPSLGFQGKIDGHLVTGHVDCTGRVLSTNSDGENRVAKILFPEEYKYFIAPKCSISVNGVSLTVIDSDINSFNFTLIPFTRNNTNLDLLKVGDLVNLEVDIISRYIINYLKYVDSLNPLKVRGVK